MAATGNQQLVLALFEKVRKIILNTTIGRKIETNKVPLKDGQMLWFLGNLLIPL